MKDNRQLLSALKARAKESREKAIAEGRTIPSIKNPILERMKAAREKAIAEGRVRPQMPNKMAEILKKMKEAKMNNN